MPAAACPNSAPGLAHEDSCESAAIYKERKKPPDLFDPAVLNIHFSCGLYSGLLPLLCCMAYIVRDLDCVPAIVCHLAFNYNRDLVVHFNGVCDVLLSISNQNCDAAAFSADLKCVAVYCCDCAVQCLLGICLSLSASLFLFSLSLSLKLSLSLDKLCFLTSCKSFGVRPKFQTAA